VDFNWINDQLKFSFVLAVLALARTYTGLSMSEKTHDCRIKKLTEDNPKHLTKFTNHGCTVSTILCFYTAY
jgi:hypothetical protein